VDTDVVVRCDYPMPTPGDVITTSSCRRREYSIRVVPDEASAIEAVVSEIGFASVAVVTDEMVARLHAERIASALEDRGLRICTVTIPSGERSKSLPMASRLLDELADSHIGRRDVLLAVGGGVVSDTAGWVASAFMRGIPYINVPTTLLAQIDASIGGKVAVDHQSAKNLIGAFYEPQAVVSCLSYLETLDSRQVISGIAEAIKVAVIASNGLFDFIESNITRLLHTDLGSLQLLVHAASVLKCALVERDPYEEDLRRPLNFGHTVGHAVETATGYGPILHGEAVALGMATALRISCARGLIEERASARIVDLLSAARLPVVSKELAVVPADDDIIRALGKVRRVRGGSLRFVLPTAIGSCAIVDNVRDDEIRAALHDLSSGRR
jgi:3-dehydroquinate synthase